MAEGNEPGEHPGKVIVVEDDPGVRDSVKVLLELAGFETVVYGSGGELLAAAPALSKGCVLLDICLPDHDGLSVWRTLSAAGVRVPVIFMTACNLRVDRLKLATSGAFAVLEKPLSDDLLLATIGEACRCNPCTERTGVSWASCKE